MKRILGIIAAAGLFTAAAPAAFAGIDVFIDFFPPAPVYVSAPPVYVAPPAVVYRHWEPRRHARHDHFDRRELRGHHEHPRRHDWR